MSLSKINGHKKRFAGLLFIPKNWQFFIRLSWSSIILL